ncbi:MiAMP1 family antimicrobial peptide [Streptomyces pini]|uniref:MiAMP1 protein n=1 Tax=Streptomyces pini TaxID=1520580 RepID=A0A1I4M0H0_9ACTN|nr:MiAMP1 family antimicrobial peptide [Streptomyces pini]SFL96603.1 MiAMP1 protein [Streptomyces pini]
MRNQHTVRTTVTAAMTAAVLAVSTGAAFASSFRGWSGAHYTGTSSEVTRCGCSNLSLGHRGSYRFDHTGQDASMFNTRNCQGSPHYTFRGDASSPAPVGWRSIYIHC